TRSSGSASTSGRSRTRTGGTSRSTCQRSSPGRSRGRSSPSAGGSRRGGAGLAALPLLLGGPQSLPVVRVETSPIGTWRLLEWKSEDDRGGSAGPCSVAYEARRPEDMPRAGETRESELLRRNAA